MSIHQHKKFTEEEPRHPIGWHDGHYLWHQRRSVNGACDRLNILETANFGRLAFTEIGALSVGRIVQSHPLNSPFRRGDRKSVFRFGGSAVVVFGHPGRWRPSEDILDQTQQGVECLVRLGEVIALRAP
jgi:hypothetical protein